MLRTWWQILKQAASEWVDDKAPKMGAALAFYSILSLAPLLLIAISIGGAVFGEDAARGRILGEWETMVGKEGAQAVSQMLANADQPAVGIWSTIVGVITLLVGAGGVFGELQDSLNTIWKVKQRPYSGIVGFIRDRFVSFAMVLGTGFLLLVSLVLSATLAAMADMDWGIGQIARLGIALHMIVSLAIVTVLFAAIFKILPDVKVRWRDVWVGAVITSLLFLLGKVLLGIYLGRSGLASSYGAAGSLVVLVVWIYYSAQIVYFGAEVTQVRARQQERIAQGEGATTAPRLHTAEANFAHS